MAQRLSDAAALGALNSMGAGGGMMPMPEEPMPEDMAAAPAEGGMEAGIAMIEGELAAAPPDLAEEARAHVEALREIGAKISGGGAPTEEIPPAAEAPIPQEGQEV